MQSYKIHALVLIKDHIDNGFSDGTLILIKSHICNGFDMLRDNNLRLTSSTLIRQSIHSDHETNYHICSGSGIVQDHMYNLHEKHKPHAQSMTAAEPIIT